MSFTSPTAGPVTTAPPPRAPVGLPGPATSLLWVVPWGPSASKGSEEQLLPSEQRCCHQDPPAGPREQASPPPPSAQGPTLGSSHGAGRCCAGSGDVGVQAAGQVPGLTDPVVVLALGAEESARLCVPRPVAAEGPRGGVPEETSEAGLWEPAVG